MTIAIMFFAVLLAVVGFVFKKWPFLMVAGLASFCAGIINVSTEPNLSLGWLVGWVLMAVSFVFFFGGAQVSLQVQREAYEKEVEIFKNLPPVISEEDAYRAQLDEAIAEGRKISRPARRKKELAETTRRLYGLGKKER